MALLTSAEVERIARKYPRGISSRSIVETFCAKGQRFSAATLRKYVQLGLLPKSRRVGARGRHRGSSGLYPVVVVRLINEIKRALDRGATLEEIRFGVVGLSGELQALQRTTDEVFGRFGEAIERRSETPRHRVLKAALAKHRRSLARELRALDRFVARIGELQGAG